MTMARLVQPRLFKDAKRDTTAVILEQGTGRRSQRPHSIPAHTRPQNHGDHPAFHFTFLFSDAQNLLYLLFLWKIRRKLEDQRVAMIPAIFRHPTRSVDVEISPISAAKRWLSSHFHQIIPHVPPRLGFWGNLSKFAYIMVLIYCLKQPFL